LRKLEAFGVSYHPLDQDPRHGRAFIGSGQVITELCQDGSIRVVQRRDATAAMALAETCRAVDRCIFVIATWRDVYEVNSPHSVKRNVFAPKTSQIAYPVWLSVHVFLHNRTASWHSQCSVSPHRALNAPAKPMARY
jgi:hypothetical protein